jgi:membrane-associated phospholipid phosphatase
VVHSLLVLKSPFPVRKKFNLMIVNLAVFVFFLWQVLWGDQLSSESWAIRFLLLWSPIIFFWVGYLWAGYTLISVHPPDKFFDRPIAQFESHYLGQPSLHWGLNRSKVSTEIFHIGYFSYYLYTISLGIYYDSTDQFELFQRMSFAVNLGYLVSYCCFALIPVAGPRWYFLETGELGKKDLKQPGFLFTRLTHKLLYGGPAHKGGAMPSSHSSTALVFFFFAAYSWGGMAGLAAFLIVLAMWIGAIYGRYHYLTDVLAGILLGVLSILAAFFLV